MTKRHLWLSVLVAVATASLPGCTGHFASDKDEDKPPEIVPGEVCDDERPIAPQLRLLTRREYASTLRDLLGVEVDTAVVPVEPRVHGFDDNAAAMVVTGRHMDAYLALAESAADQAVTTQKGKILKCDPASATCAKEFVRDFGLRAFRRPLTTEEVDAYAAAFTGQSFDDGLRVAIGAMLISPNFLYRFEVGQADGDAATLTDYEVASALSYLFWGTMPDDALFAAASAGELRTPEQITAQARRLLADPRAQVQVAEFAIQWLRTDGLAGNKDAQIYPNFTDDIRAAMDEELRRFVVDVIFTKNGTFRDLFVADYVIANKALAGFYGLTATSDDFAPIPVAADSGRGGLLGMGAVLASHAHSNESSPVKRGVFVRDRLLCQELTPPPPTLDTTPPGLDPALTTRERFDRHRSDPVCAGCHTLIDPVGFGFEGFDGVGARRTVENGKPVDMSGEMVGLDDLSDPTVLPFNDTRELGAMIADSEAAQQCLPLQYFRYARGITEDEYDACAVHNLQLTFDKADLNVQEMLVAITAQPTFIKRKAK